MESYDEPSTNESLDSNEIYLKYHKLTHKNKHEKIFSKRFLQKYIHYAKSMRPKLSLAATDSMSRLWTELRGLDLNSETNEEG